MLENSRLFCQTHEAFDGIRALEFALLPRGVPHHVEPDQILDDLLFVLRGPIRGEINDPLEGLIEREDGVGEYLLLQGGLKGT